MNSSREKEKMWKGGRKKQEILIYLITKHITIHINYCMKKNYFLFKNKYLNNINE
jgi:hypothetical protein